MVRKKSYEVDRNLNGKQTKKQTKKICVNQMFENRVKNFFYFMAKTRF